MDIHIKVEVQQSKTHVSCDVKYVQTFSGRGSDTTRATKPHHPSLRRRLHRAASRHNAPATSVDSRWSPLPNRRPCPSMSLHTAGQLHRPLFGRQWGVLDRKLISSAADLRPAGCLARARELHSFAKGPLRPEGMAPGRAPAGHSSAKGVLVETTPAGEALEGRRLDGEPLVGTPRACRPLAGQLAAGPLRAGEPRADEPLGRPAPSGHHLGTPHTEPRSHPSTRRANGQPSMS
mmetsp:Transcript_54765/g.157490  ORF Transcript_54765/g.157490 Transcript_54765/m.157490 type:complete len:234 (-) Transcript_54765:414-1115(-)